MSLYGHLAELRTRLTRALAAIFVGFFIGYAFHLELFDLVVAPVRDALADRGLYRLQALHVTESIFVYLKLSAVAGIMGAFPYILVQIWGFISPGLLDEERRYVTPIVLFSSLFFALGVLFSYSVLLPFVTGFLTDLTLGSSAIELQVTVENVFSFSLMSLLLFGVVFQLPILMFFLAMLGVATHKSFLSFYRYFIVISFVIGALLTPPEPVSQILMALPMNLLYGLGIVIAYLIGSRKKDPETGEFVPIGKRIWLIVTMVLSLFVGAIVGGVWLLQPGPRGSDLIPDTTQIAAGFNPSQTSSFSFIESAGKRVGLNESPLNTLKEAASKEEKGSILYFQTGIETGAIVLPKTLVESSGLLTLFDKPNTHSSGLGMTYRDGDDAPALYHISKDWFLLGQSGAIEAAETCRDDELRCLRSDSTIEQQMVDLRTGGPAWAWLAGASPGLQMIPYGGETEGIKHMTWLMDLEQGVDLYGTLHMTSEAASRAYKTRIDLWQDQSIQAMQDELDSKTLSSDVRTLANALSALAESTSKAMNSTEKLVPEKEREAFKKANAELTGELRKIQVTASELSKQPEVKAEEMSVKPLMAQSGFIAVIPKAELKDWTLTTEETAATFHLQTTRAGIREWVDSFGINVEGNPEN